MTFGFLIIKEVFRGCLVLSLSTVMPRRVRMVNQQLCFVLPAECSVACVGEISLAGKGEPNRLGRLGKHLVDHASTAGWARQDLAGNQAAS